MMPGIAPRLVTLLLVGLAGCSLSTLDPTGCDTHLECRENFGMGSVCSDSFCIAADNPRCSLYAEDATLPLDPVEHLLYATMFNHSSETHRVRVRSARLAAIQANGLGGLDGRQYAILECTIEENSELDGLSQADAVEELSTYLAETIDVPAIVGPASSTDVQAAFSAFGSTPDTLMVSPSATSPSLTSLDRFTPSDETPGLLWRTAPPDTLQAEVIANDMIARDVVAPVVLVHSGAYGDGLSELFAAKMPDDVHIDLILFSDADGRDQATLDAVAANADEVLFISSEVDEIVAFLNAAADIPAYEDVGIFLTDAAATASVLTDASGASALFGQIRGTKPSIPSGNLYDTFLASYASQYDGQDADAFSFAAHTYDASWMVIYGSAWATYNGDTSNSVDFARGLRKLSDGTAVQIRVNTWNDVRSEFTLGNSIDVVGTSGALDYDPDTEETTAAIEVWTIEDSTIQVEYVSE